MATSREFIPARWETLLQAARQLARARSLDDVVEIVRATARHVTGADGVTFVRCVGDHCEYVAEDAMQPFRAGQRFKVSECVPGWVIRHGEAAIISDIAADDRVSDALYAGT